MSDHAQTMTTVISLGSGTLALTTGIALSVRRIAQMMKPLNTVAELAPKLVQIVEDFGGVEDRPGVPGRLGVMPALEQLREGQEKHDRGQVRIIDDLGTVKTQIRQIQSGSA